MNYMQAFDCMSSGKISVRYLRLAIPIVGELKLTCKRALDHRSIIEARENR
jgi:hypothetical protein